MKRFPVLTKFSEKDYKFQSSYFWKKTQLYQALSSGANVYLRNTKPKKSSM